MHMDKIHVGAITLSCIDHVLPVQHLRDVLGLQAFIEGSMVPCVALQKVSICQLVVLSPADFSQGKPGPLQEPSVSWTRLSIILTAALNLGFFCRQLQAAVNSFTCT